MAERLWYMRDNHTFRELPLDVEQAIAVLREEYAKGNSYGMLHAHGGRPVQPMTIDPHAHGRADFAEFEPRARIWLAAELSYKSPADLEIESWTIPSAPSGMAQAAGEGQQAEQKLAAAGVFKGADGLRRLAECQDFWDKQPYGTRLYFEDAGDGYLHRDVLRAAVQVLDASPAVAPSAQPLTDTEAHRIHSHPFVRSLLLEYVERPDDARATALVRCIHNALSGLLLGAAPSAQEPTK